MEEIICYCSHISKAQLWDALHNGAKTLNVIRKATGSCTVGRCHELSPNKKCCSPNILAVIDEYSLLKQP
ncbi:MAG: (2Fe-2S)-binding protein [Oscillospiraceae bacterium]